MGHYDDYTDERLVERMRATDAREQRACRNELFQRVYPRVAKWCLHLCHDRDMAADLAQDVVERVNNNIDTFRLESRFSTWLYTVTRRTAINKLVAERRHHRLRVDERSVPEAADTTLSTPDLLTLNTFGERMRDVMEAKLEPMEAQVVYLHYVDGMTLPAITRLLGLTNKSGSKAFLVGGMRKLRRHLGPWIEREFAA